MGRRRDEGEKKRHGLESAAKRIPHHPVHLRHAVTRDDDGLCETQVKKIFFLAKKHLGKFPRNVLQPRRRKSRRM